MRPASTLARKLATLLLSLAPAFAVGCAGGDGITPGEDVGADAEGVCPKPKTVRGVDVSYFQHSVDWKKAKHSGIEFAFARTSDGESFVDPQFAANWRHMKQAGVLRGTYHLFRPTEDPKAQADLLIHQIRSAGGLEDGDLPPALDIEEIDGASDATIKSRAKVWLERVEHAFHRTPIIYVSPAFWAGLGNPASFDKYVLWVANWGVSCPSVPGGSWHGFTFWQYSDHGSVPGIDGTVDSDRFNGSLDDLKAFAHVGHDHHGPSLAAEEATVMAEELDDEGSTDINGDGKADLCARTEDGVRCHLSNGHGFDKKTIEGPDLGDNDTWDQASHFATLRFADINGDGKADLCARGNDGVKCWLSDGHGFGKGIETGLLAGEAWDEQRHYGTLRMADVNGDGKADLCARTSDGFKCWLSHGHGFGKAIEGPAWDDDGAFAKVAGYGTIRMADVNGDGRADVCGLGAKGVVCYLSNGHGFPHRVEGPALDGDAWDHADYWATVRFADLNGDGKADLCARRSGGITCWLSHGDGFGKAIQGPQLADDAGWSAHDRYSTIRLADVDGDGHADLCARGADGLKCWFWNGHGFGGVHQTTSLSDDAHGDRPSEYRTIRFADVNGDGRMDFCFRGANGIRCRHGQKDGLGPLIDGPAWSDDAGWKSERRYTSIALQ